MPLIDSVARKSFKIKLLIIFMYIGLCLGGITMVYPFLLMLASSTTSEVDYTRFDVIPKYYYDDNALFQKYVNEKYTAPGANIALFNQRYKTDYIKFDEINMPQYKKENVGKLLADWNEFTDKLPEYYKITGFRRVGSTTGQVERDYRAWIQKKYGTIENINKIYTSEYEQFLYVRAPTERLDERGYMREDNTYSLDFVEFKKTVDAGNLYYAGGEGVFQDLLAKKYQNEVEKLNLKYKTNYKSFYEVPLAARYADSKIKADWLEYATGKFPLRYMKIDMRAEGLYQRYLKKKYKSIDKLNLIYQLRFKGFNEVKLKESYAEEKNRPVVNDVYEFMKDDAVKDYILIESVENKYTGYVKSKYKTIQELNSAYNTAYKEFSEAKPPYGIVETETFKKQTKALRKFFLGNNYKEVIEYIALHGRAVMNTLIFCLAAILTTITVNPMCAYALSRFNLSYGNKVLLFLLATMAFPAEVGMIPGFLMLKDFHLLNTYWAIILPGLASGYSIFILKGFYDSLPREIYEAAQMDGASEMRIFFNITLPLAKPVLAYLSLGAFVGSYTAFMFAMLVCQKPEMWTLMVWLYEMQEWAPAYVIMSALTLSSIPTLLIFIFAQRVIMRGIIIPVQH